MWWLSPGRLRPQTGHCTSLQWLFNSRVRVRVRVGIGEDRVAIGKEASPFAD